MKLFRVLGPVFLVLSFSYFISAQTSRVGGDLKGTVTDTTGAAVPGAVVTATNVASGQQRSQSSDDEGRFHVRDLSAGEYRVAVSREGFKRFESNLTVALGSTVSVMVELVPASSTEQVTVSAEPNAIDPTQTAVATNIDPERIEESPVRSRNYLNFALLAPGVSAASQHGSSTATTLPSSGFTFGGLRPRSNAIYIDGVDNNDEFTGASRTELSLETVREFQVVNQGLSAEAGGAAGGSINVVTKSGADIVHGDLFVFGENAALNARPPLEAGGRKPSVNRYRVGVSVGGPIKKGRTFYYTGFEQEHARGQAASDIDPSVIATLNPFLQQDKVAGLHGISNDLFPIARAETEASLRLDHQLTSSTMLFMRYAFTNNRESNDAFNTADIVDFTARGSDFTKDNTLAGGLTKTSGANFINDLRFQVATRREVQRTADPNAPGILIPGVVEFGRPYSGNSTHRENHYELGDSVSQAFHRHLFKVGVGVNRIDERADVLDGFGGIYVFRGVQDLLNAVPAYFQQAFGNPNANFSATRYSGFVQDHWTVSSKVTVDAGLRYDFEQLPAPFNQDTNNFSPRIGIAFSPTANWVLRSGFGIFFDRYPLAYVNHALEKNGTNAFDQIVDSFSTPIPLPLSTAASGLPGIAPSKYDVQPGMANPYSEVASAEVECLVTRNLSFSATYSFVRGVKMPRTVNVNLPKPVTLTLQNAASLGVQSPDPQQLGREVFPTARLNSSFDGIYKLENSAASTYHGFTVAANRRLANEFTLLASYTVSKAIDDASDFDEAPQNPYNLKAERAVSINNQAQRLTVSALFDLPIGEEEEGRAVGSNDKPLITRMFSHIEMAPILSIASGRPVNPVTGLDSNRSHTFPFASRPPGYGRNSLSTPPTAVLDLRVLKFFKVGQHGQFDIVAETFNLFNRTNVSQINPWFGAQSTPVASFERPGEAMNPRQLQFSLDFEF
jgi:outer membrane receptor protein involved in Fe transport